MAEERSFSKDSKDNNFFVRLLDNQYGTWQGEIIWLESNEKECFCSLIEMLHLISNTTGASFQTAALEKHELKGHVSPD